MEALIAEEPLVRLQYIHAGHPETLEPVREWTGPVLIGLAAFVGETRLIDNILTGSPPAP